LNKDFEQSLDSVTGWLIGMNRISLWTEHHMGSPTCKPCRCRNSFCALLIFQRIVNVIHSLHLFAALASRSDGGTRVMPHAQKATKNQWNGCLAYRTLSVYDTILSANFRTERSYVCILHADTKKV